MLLEGSKLALAGKRDGLSDTMRRIKELEAMIVNRERVIGELTIANRILKNRKPKRSKPGAKAEEMPVGVVQWVVAFVLLAALILR